MNVSAINSLALLNMATNEIAQAWFMQTCTAEKWCINMVKQRPFSNIQALTKEATKQWNKMTIQDFLQAFSGHPMIGDLSTLREKYANTKALAINEQSGAQGASEVTLKTLQKINLEYQQKHGFIFIICATGLSAKAMLNELQVRLPKSTETEIRKAAQEQIKITLLRINNAFSRPKHKG
jgi:2-oxo-4-hydroxy-4-carboxy-5-ureidoimidazoline decarboxylase